MKKLSITLAALLIIISLQAQKTPLKFGAKAGVNIAGIRSNDVKKEGSRVSFNGGVLAKTIVNRMFSIQPEILFSGQGYKQDSDTKLAFNYLNIPVVLQYNNANGIYAETGPQLGLLINAKVTNGNGTTKIKNYYAATDVSWCFGLGYQTKSGAGVGARYNLGITDISKSSSKVNNSVFAISVFYMLSGLK